MKLLISFFVLFVLSCANTVLSEDVKRFRGHDSQGKYDETGLLKKWPEKGLTPKWINKDLGGGWSSAIKIKDRLYVNGLDASDRKNEAIVCLDLNGKKLWQSPTGKTWPKSYAAPRSTPTYVFDEKEGKGKLVVLTGAGEVCCLASDDGRLLWKKDIAKTYQSKTGTWGFAESLVVKDGKVFATSGGKKASVVALDLKDGKVLWEAPSNGDKLAYVTPILYKNQLIQVTSTYVFGVDVETGKILWKTNFLEETGGTSWRGINCNVPLLKDNHLFVTAGYDQGGVMYEILPNNKGVKILWKTEDLDPHHGGVVLLDGRIYGSNWINNSKGNWLGVDWKTGKTIYDTAWGKLGKGSIITADGMIYIYEEKRGTLGLLKPGDKFDVVNQFRVKFGSRQHWAHPIISDGVLYVRHGNALAAFDIRKNK